LNEEERNVFVNRDATMDKEEVMRLKALHQNLSLKLLRKFKKLDEK